MSNPFDDLLKDMDEVLNVKSPQKQNNKPIVSYPLDTPKTINESPPKKVFLIKKNHFLLIIKEK